MFYFIVLSGDAFLGLNLSSIFLDWK